MKLATQEDIDQILDLAGKVDEKFFRHLI